MPNEENTVVDDIADDVAAAISEVSTGQQATPTETPASAEPSAPAKDSSRDAGPAGERERDEQGRFKPKEEKPAEVAPEQSRDSLAKPAGDQSAQAPASGAAQAPKASPPPGWSVKSKSQWDKLPEDIRAEIAKREKEVSDGFAEYQGLRPYARRCQEGGTTLVNALQAYTGIEDLLRRDPETGHLHLAERSGLTQYQAGQFFARLAQRLGFQGPANGSSPPPNQNGGANPELQQILSPLLNPLAQEINQLKAHLQQQSETSQLQKEHSANAVIEQFASDPANKYYTNLEDNIANLLNGGVVQRTGDMRTDLKAAYDMACRMHPEVSELLINERMEQLRGQKQTNADKARQASRSVNGSPSPGNSEGKRPQSAPPGSQSYEDDLEEDVRNAVRAASALA